MVNYDWKIFAHNRASYGTLYNVIAFCTGH
jgi:hypothetical protein